MLRYLKFLPGLIGACLMGMMQVGPSEAEINFCKWAQLVRPDIEAKCLAIPHLEPIIWTAAATLIASSLVLWIAAWYWLRKPKTNRRGPQNVRSPPSVPSIVSLERIWKPRGGSEDIVAVFQIKAMQRAKDVAFIGRYAEAVHYVDSADWEWVPSTRLRNFTEISPPENWEIEAIRRRREKPNTVTIFDHFVLNVKDDRLILLRLDVVSDRGIQHIDNVYNVETVNGAQRLTPLHLSDVAFITGANPNGAGGVQASERISVLELFSLAEHQFAWDLNGEHSLDILDLIYGLRQAGSDGLIQFWGKINRNRSDILTRNELLVAIPRDHWADYELDIWKARAERDNLYLWTINKRAVQNVIDGGYADVHADRAATIKWLQTMANEYKGHTKR